MKLLIDTREPNTNINYLKANSENLIIETTNLDLGDYIIYDEINSKNIIIFERKSLNDLESSIKDGRYKEQSFRLNNLETENHNIIYLIEGNIINHRNTKFRKNMYSALVSLNFYKGFSIFNSASNVETCDIILSFINKILKEKNINGYYTSDRIEKNNNIDNSIDNSNNSNSNNSNIDSEYVKVIKSSKKSNITKDNILCIMLMQIPNISKTIGEALVDKYDNLDNLLYNIKNNTEDLYTIKINSRKISSKAISSLIEFLK